MKRHTSRERADRASNKLEVRHVVNVADNNEHMAVTEASLWERDHAAQILRRQDVHEEKLEEAEEMSWTPKRKLKASENGALWSNTVARVPVCHDIFSPNTDVTVPWSLQMTHTAHVKSDDRAPKTEGGTCKTDNSAPKTIARVGGDARTPLGHETPSSRVEGMTQQVLNFSSPTPVPSSTLLLEPTKTEGHRKHCPSDRSAVDRSAVDASCVVDNDCDTARSTDDATAHDSVPPVDRHSSLLHTGTGGSSDKTCREEGLLSVKTRSSGSALSSRSRFLTRSARRGGTTPRLLFNVGSLLPKGDGLRPIPEDVIVNQEVYRKRPDEVGYGCTGMKKRAPPSVDVYKSLNPPDFSPFKKKRGRPAGCRKSENKANEADETSGRVHVAPKNIAAWRARWIAKCEQLEERSLSDDFIIPPEDNPFAPITRYVAPRRRKLFDHAAFKLPAKAD